MGIFRLSDQLFIESKSSFKFSRYLFWRAGRTFSVHIPEAPESVVPMAIAEVPPPSDVAADLLEGVLDTSFLRVYWQGPRSRLGLLPLLFSGHGSAHYVSTFDELSKC